MKKGMTIFALTTILCGAAAITENHNQAFARSGSHSSGHSASSGRSSHSSGHSASSGRSSHSSEHSASSGRSSHSSGHSASSGRSSHSSGHSASSGKSSHSSGHSVNSGKNSHSKGHSATVGRSTNSKGHSVTTGKGSNFKGHTAVVGRNSSSKTNNTATKGKNVNTKNVANSKNSATSLVANHNKAYNKKSNETTNYKNIANSHLDAIVAGHNKAFTKKSTKPTNSKNIAISHLDAIVAEHDKAFITKTSNSKTVATKKNTDKNAEKVNLVNKEKAVDPKLTANNETVVDTKKYKTKEEISKLSNSQLIKDIIKNREGKDITHLHGHYCGPGYGDIKNGPPPVDLLDLGCKIHDIGYDQKGYFNRDVNNRFIEFVNKNASKMKPAERERAYYYAEGFERMNKTPLQEIAKVVSIISAPFRAVGNLITGGVKAIGSLFKPHRTVTVNVINVPTDRSGNEGKSLYPWLKKPRVAR